MCVFVCVLERSGFSAQPLLIHHCHLTVQIFIHKCSCNWFCFEIRAYAEFNGRYYVLNLLSCINLERRLEAEVESPAEDGNKGVSYIISMCCVTWRTSISRIYIDASLPCAMAYTAH